MPDAGSFPFRGGVTLIISAPELYEDGNRGEAEVRYAISKCIKGPDSDRRKARQREYLLAQGLANGDTDDPKHFQVNFGLLHQGF
jgi:hypothetical protein